MKKIFLYGLSAILLIIGVTLPSLLGYQFTKYPDDLPPEYFYFIQYTLKCVFIFTALIIIVLFILKMIHKK